MGVEKWQKYATLTFIVGIYAFCGGLFALLSRQNLNAEFEIFRAKSIFADRSEGGRILLGGGSNVVWGYRSRLLEEDVGVPTTNLALESEGGDPKAMRELLLSVAKRGDVFIYSSISFWGFHGVDEVRAYNLLRAAGIPQKANWRQDIKTYLSWFWLPLPKDHTLAFSMPKLFQRYFRGVLEGYPGHYNDRGDLKSCQKIDIVPKGFVNGPEDIQGFLSSMRDFRQRLLKKGAEVVFEVPWLFIHESEQKKWSAAFQPQLNQLRSEVFVISSEIEQALKSDRALFCDTEFHLSNEGALIRTHQMAAFLKQSFEKKARSLNLAKALQDKLLNQGG